jgi:DNA polymerase-1
MEKFYIIDGNAYIHRAYHALPPLATSDNKQVNAVFGFIKLILKIKNNFHPDYFAVCFDYPAKNFRHQISNEYKANRKPLDEALIEQMPIARKAVDALNVKRLEIEGYEADDIIASIAAKNKREKIQTVIVTGDKDILQIVDDGVTYVFNDSKDMIFDEKKVYEKYEVLPCRLIDVFALMGDASDNIPGVRGIGEKTAVKLIKEYTTLQNVLDNISSIKGRTGELLRQGKQDALKSKELVKLKDDIPIDIGMDEFKTKEIDTNKAVKFFQEYEFDSLTAKFSHKDIAGGNTKSFLDQKPVKDPNEKEIVKKETIPPLESEIINNLDGLKKAAAEIKQKGIVAIHTLTSSETSLYQAKIVGISLCAGGTAYYIPVGHNDLTTAQMSFGDFKLIFEEILISKEIKKIGYDLKRERNIYFAQNIKIDGLFFDIMIAAYCLYPANRSINFLSKKYLDFDAGDDSYLGKASKKISCADANISDACKYGASITYASYKLYELFQKEMTEKKLEKLFFDIEMPLVEILSDMERYGIKIDVNLLNKFNEEINGEIKKVQSKIFDLAGTEFNINSPKQLADIMFVKLNIPSRKKTKTGYSTDEEVLEGLSSFDFPREVLKYREFQKLKSSYIDPIRIYCAHYGDRIHTVFNQTITATGRLSSTDPNLQNIPIKSEYGKEFRRIFIAEDGKVFVSADYSQIDLRVLAHISGDKKLTEAFRRGDDIHSATAREVFGIEKDEELSNNLRSAAKAINFGIIYGISPFGLSKQLNVSLNRAGEYIEKYLQRYDGVKKWMMDAVNEAKKNGFVRTLSGRIRYIPELYSAKKQIVAAGERIALNTTVQGSSADIIKIAMINIDKEIKKENYKTKMLLQVHDDLLFLTPKNEIENTVKLAKDKMENAIKLNVPLCVDIKSGLNWSDMDNIK